MTTMIDSIDIPFSFCCVFRGTDDMVLFLFFLDIWTLHKWMKCSTDAF